MIVKKFHQFIHLERGPKNTAIIDFLKENIFQVENEVIDKFLNGKYSEISDFIRKVTEEELIIEIDNKRWIPHLSFDSKTNLNADFSFELEIEEGINPRLIKHKLKCFEIFKIIFYGKRNPPKFFTSAKIIKKEKNFIQCIKRSEITGEFWRISKSLYSFNKKYNSCWGKKIAITRDNKIRPCIFSEIIIGDLQKDDVYDMLEKAKKYWFITKDRIKNCKDCELRYVCFDCREIVKRKTNDLYASNPYCKYNPYKGIWEN